MYASPTSTCSTPAGAEWRPRQHAVDDSVGEAHPSDEVPLRIGLGESDDPPLELEHQRFLSTWAAAASDADRGVAARAAAQLGIDTL